MAKKIDVDYLLLGDELGLTKIEVLYVLQDVILEAGLHQAATTAIEKAAEESIARLEEIHANELDEED